MNVIIIAITMFTLTSLANSIPKKTRAYSKAHHRSTLEVYKNKGIPHTSSSYVGRGIASEKVEKIPWEKKPKKSR